jgi:hypothetical protein
MRMPLRSVTILWASLLLVIAATATPATAQDDPPAVASMPTRPAILFNRWQENWSVLADPAMRTEPLDNLKYIPLNPNDPQSYISLGMNLRERFESNGAPSFGVGHQPTQNYVIQRYEIDADIHPNANWQIFGQIEDDRAFGKTPITPADEDVLDLEQAFVAYNTPFLGGNLKIRVGRQEIGFDLQRFVSVRDGPNVRQAYDAIWADWELSPWRIISFWSWPVQYRTYNPFDDFSNEHLQYGGFRVERSDVGPGKLSAYVSRYDNDYAHYLFASGAERRNILDIRYAGEAAGFDWDLEAMGQDGSVGSKNVRAWAVGALTGYTFSDLGWKPRVGLQLDAASGDQHPNSNTIGTFNPLFPNGYYFTLAGYTGYTNLIHVKPSITVTPTAKLKLLGAVGALWRQTTADAVYTQPDIPVPGTAGKGSRWTGLYQQIRADYSFNANVTGAIEAVHYDVGETIREAGGHDSEYVGVEFKVDW